MNIAVTGYGIVSALGIGRDTTYDALLNRRSGVGRMSVLNSVHGELPVGEVPYSDGQLAQMAGVGEDGNHLPRTTLLGIIAAREALAHAGITNTADAAFISGTTVGGMDITERLWHNIADADVCVTIAANHGAAECTAEIARRVGPFAFVTTISTACSSALNAIIYGANLIRTRRFKRVIVGGAEALTIFHLNGFNSLRILDNDICRPFDVSRNGLNLGEGAAYIVLEDLRTAKSRKARIHAFIGGFANRCDAFHQTATSEEAIGPRLAMSDALRCAGLRPRDVDYINAHGTATQNNDQTEYNAINYVFGDNVPPFASTKSYTGHTTSASGSIETVICLLGMRHGMAFGNLNVKNGLTRNKSLLRKNAKNRMDVVMCNSFGFGGNDSSLILTRRPQAKMKYAVPDGCVISSFTYSCDDPSESKEFLTPLQSRRMTTQMRCIVAAALKVLRMADTNKPDAIIARTRWGCIHNSVVFLNDMIANAEQELSPTPFMQSTHNTVASQIAIMLACNGYNSTIVPEARHADAATTEANMLMETGVAGSVLILDFDEPDETWDEILLKASTHPRHMASATLLIKQ